MASSRLVVDTSIVIAWLRGSLEAETLMNTLDGRTPAVSPVTVHELRRGVRPGSKWENQLDRLVPGGAILAPPPSTQDWVAAADVIRTCFAGRRPKAELAALAHDALIVLCAKGLGAEVWSRDGDFKQICESAGVRLLDH